MKVKVRANNGTSILTIRCVITNRECDGKSVWADAWREMGNYYDHAFTPEELQERLIEILPDKNQQILQESMAAYNKRRGPRVGDFLRNPDGTFTRFTHDWGDHIQTGGGSNSFYLGNGYCSYSGSLDTGIMKADIVRTKETKKGMIWFFNEGWSGPNRAVHYEVDFRVFDIKEGADISGLNGYHRSLKQNKAGQ